MNDVGAAFAEAKRKADEALAAGNPGLAAEIYRELLTRIPADHPLATDAKFHRAQLLDAAGFTDVAIPILVELARERHEGAWKALDRMLEESWASAREAPPGVPGRPARDALRRLVEKLGAPTAQAGSAAAWLDATEAEEQLAAADQAYQRGDYANALAQFEEAGNRARTRGLMTLARKALGQAAAVAWHNLHDLTATLRVLSALGPAVAEMPAMKLIHEKAAAALADDLRALVRRGDRRDAFVKLAAVLPLLPTGEARTDELIELYLRELASHHISALDNRLIAVSRQATQSAQEAAGPGGGATPPHDRVRLDPADQVAARLRLYALEEERDRLTHLRRELVAREMAVLRKADVARYLELLEASRESGALGVLLDRVRRLALERMHYRVKLKSETKDALASLLPDFLSHRLVDDTYQLIRRLEGEVDALAVQFLEHAYRAAQV